MSTPDKIQVVSRPKASADFEKFLKAHHPNAIRGDTLAIYSLTGSGFIACLNRAFRAGMRSERRRNK